jgi:hypothetical protein
VQSARENVGGVLFAVGGNVDFREIQIKLRVAAIHSNRGVAKFFRLRPFLLRGRDGNAYIGNVKRIAGILIERGAQTRQRFVSVTATQICKASSEFLERLEMNHEEALRKDAGTRAIHARRRENRAVEFFGNRADKPRGEEQKKLLI